MRDYVRQRSIRIQVDPTRNDIMTQIRAAVDREIDVSETPIRFAVTNSESDFWTCELGTVNTEIDGPGIFEFSPRSHEDNDSFNVVMLVPTGIGASVGGHAGDATPAAALLSAVCDVLITHPNVLNASDIIQIPTNAMYVEGSLISQLMMGSLGLLRRRNNRLLVLVQRHEDEMFVNAAINSVNAACASYGVIASIAEIDPRFRMVSEYTDSGMAAGRIEGIEYVYDLLDRRLGGFDAVAITSVIDLPLDLHENYYSLVDEIANPWGGVEAMLTHAISLRYGVPSAHAPMLECRSVAENDFGVVDPRTAAEVISLAFLQCVLRGLQTHPGVACPALGPGLGANICAANVSCLVIPDGCIGLPTLAALLNRIPVVVVRGNTNLMRNNLDLLPWGPTQLHRAANYLETAGIVAALRAGLAPSSVLRPLPPTPIQRSAGSPETTQASSATEPRPGTRA